MARTQPQTLQKLWRGEFTIRTRARGSDYLRHGLVTLTAVEPGRADAVVRGSEPYEVSLTWDPDSPELRGACSCPAFIKFGPCKHMWAVVLGIDTLDIESPDVIEELDDWDDEDEDDYEEEWEPGWALNESALRSPTRPSEVTGSWRSRLEQLRRWSSTMQRDPWRALAAEDREIRYAIDVERTLGSGLLIVTSHQRRRLKNGGWSEPRPYSPADDDAAPLDPGDRRFFAALFGALPERRILWSIRDPRGSNQFALAAEHCDQLLPLLCATGRLDWRSRGDAGEGLRWDDGDPWVLDLKVTRAKKESVLSGVLTRGEQQMDLAEPLVLLGLGFLVTRETVARFDPRNAMHHVVDLRAHGSLRVPSEAEPELVGALIDLPGRAVTELPGLERTTGPEPTPHLYIEGSAQGARAGRRLTCRVTFDYGGEHVAPEEPREALLLPGQRRFVRRDLEAEARALARFLVLGGRRTQQDQAHELHGSVAARRLPEIVRALVAEGWTVEAEGRLWRRSSGSSASVRSGLDWFELEGGLEFGGQTASFPQLLAAAKERRDVVELGDGSIGILPERWLERWGLLTLAKGTDGDRLRFSLPQAWLLDAFLAERADVRADAGFARYRKRLQRFDGVKPGREPRSFKGTLRAYQRDGLGWFAFLRELGLGGCLADDMGLGKTVQVLALLESLRLARKPRKASSPSLVVAPSSLVFNWVDEAARFAPRLRVADYTGPDRKQRLDGPDPVDLAVTTYGTLRRDIVELKERHFHYVILDEATAIKNAASLTAKAARLLDADHRLALSGTPVENHIGELWSLFESLNPGMLGRASGFKAFASLPRGSDSQSTDLEGLARALRPFFLRRTKAQVLDDLPEKTEQTLPCELGKAERRQYDELRDHYRAALLGRADEGGIERMKIQVLEALLRLRQCACHAGLIDPERAAESSAKLDVLLPRLEEVAVEGHKALVFSQFTKLLAIVRARLDALGLRYEYLDGRTRNRRDKVERFQNDADCPLFLVSLKAGGHGLNLTAADYVFLLDPWWNPAVEAQAIDRAHRIGRELPVFAYRLIARGTVEEKVLELQARKRELAETLLGGGPGVLKDLTREDLERLLT